MVAYAMRITDLNPLQHGLIFERFLNPDRVSMPDFDVDFDERRRGDVIRYVTEKYGDDRVAQIVTYGTIKAKQAVKDSARVLGMPFSVGDRITKVMPPPVMGKDVSLAKMFEPSDPRYSEGGEFRTLVETDPDVKRVVEMARGLEGLKRQWGVHAAGVIMSSDPLLDLIPIMKRELDGAIITQFDYPTCEKLGLIKMDFLGLRNLTVLDDALINIKANRGETIVLEDLALDDQKTFDLLARGDTLGVFQLDGGPMRALLRSMRPDNFEDISAVGALYRPGPMGANSHNEYADRKNGRKPVVPIHPELAEPLAEILGDTYGLIVYQEQVMAIAQHVAGYSLGAADLLRRAMGKKKKSELDAQFEKFSGGMADRGYSPAAIKTLWDILLPFSDYAFNKAHSAAYGLVSYWTAYLKANYPAEYMAALLTSVGDDKDKMAIYLAECRSMGIKVLPPDVNTSVRDFAPVGTDIRFGLSAVRNVGTGVVASIVASRKDKGDYTDFYDFLEKVDQVACNKKVVESLIKAGAFDSLGPSPQGPADGARQGHRRGAGAEEGRGDRAVRPVRRDEPGGEGRLVPRQRPGHRVGHQAAPGIRAGNAGAVRLRASAGRGRAHPVGAVGRVHPGHPGRHHPGPRDGHGRRHPDRAAAPADQEGRPLGVGDPGGPGRRRRGRVLPEGVPGLLAAAGRGRDRAGQGPGGPLRGPAVPARPAGGGAGPVGVGGQGAGAGQHRRVPLHPAGGRPAA